MKTEGGGAAAPGAGLGYYGVGRAWDDDRDEPGKTLAVYYAPYLSQVSPRAEAAARILVRAGVSGGAGGEAAQSMLAGRLLVVEGVLGGGVGA